ncbi:MAG: DNA polymerase III subunit beta [Planctomycetota bacterium]|nr:MAG: DNA polymerase III subunit beta [Planctomycetota bacterium]
MKVACDRERLTSAFQVAASVVSTKSPKDILQNVKVETGDGELTLMASGAETGVRIQVPEVEVIEPGKALFHVERVGRVLRESSDEKLEFETKDNNLFVRGIYAEIRIPTANPDEYPTIPGFTEESYHELPAGTFREMVRRTAFATDQESARFALGGVLFEMTDDKVVAVGTDGRRLAVVEGAGTSVGGHKTEGNATIIPTKSLVLMERSISDEEAPVHLAVHGNEVLFRTNNCTINARLVEGRFPNWRQVIPDRTDSVQIDVNVGPLLSSIRQAAVVADKETRGLDMIFGDGTLLMTASHAEQGESRVELPIDYTGDKVAVKLDYRFIIDFLKVLEPETRVKLDIESSKSPAVLKTDDGYTYIVMPMALD